MTNRTQPTRTDEERHDTKVGTAIIPGRKWVGSHFVYVIEDRQHQAIKIGIAKDPYRRAIDLQVGNPSELRVAQCFEVINADRARDIEQKAHKALSAHPPAYSEYIGRQAIAFIQAQRAAA